MSIELPQHNEVLVFRVNLDLCDEGPGDASVRANGHQSLNETALSADEIAKAERFLIERVRNRYIVGRLALRHIIGRMLGENSDSIRFKYGKWGKPQVDRLLVPALHFNVSHCEGWAAIAFSQKELGVDLELPRPRLKAKAILPQILADEEQLAWSNTAASTHEEQALRLWTCKEALLKAMGLGISEGLKKICFPVARLHEKTFRPLSISPSLQLFLDDAGDCRMTHWTDAATWRLFRLSLLEKAECSIATPLKDARFKVRDFDVESLGFDPT